MKALLWNNGGIKSLNLDAFPAAAWTSVFGAASESSVNALDLYETIPWLHRGVNARVNALAAMPHAMHREDEDGDELEHKDWPIKINLKALIGALYKDYIIFARAYTFINRNPFGGVADAEGNPVDIRRFQPDTIKPKTDTQKGIVGWERTLNGQVIPYNKEDIAHWYKPPVRTETGYDVSDVMVALAAAGVIRNSDLYAENHYKHGGVNTTLIWDETASMNETEQKRVESWFQRSVEGIRNAFRYRVVGGKFGHLTLGYPIKDLVVPELTNSKREDIATALGVPQSIMFSNAANFATAYQDDLHFYNKTIIPDGEALEEVLNEFIFNPMGYHLRFHPERMELYQRIETDKAQSLKTLVDGSIWTRREARQATNMPDEPAIDDPQYKEFTKVKEKQEIPPELEAANAIAQVNQQDKPDEDNPFADDMKRWQAKALNRFNEGKLAKALEFTSDVIPASLVAAIKGGLEACASKDAIKAVFDNAMQWQSYP